MTKLLTAYEVAVEWDTTEEHIIGLVRDGKLKYVNIGRGTKRPRYRFTHADLAEFVEASRKREEIPCRFSRSGKARSTNTTSSSVVIGFTAQRNARLAKKPKNLKP